MAIPASQLETWSRQGATVAAQATYTSVKAALDADSSPVKTVNKEIFLQGSYRNSTNIHGESDVDIVVKLNGVYTSNTVGLNAYEKAVFARDFRTASYGWQEFRRDVLQALRNYYGAGQVVEGNKCLKVLRQPGRLQADVVPAIEHRLYTSYLGGSLHHIENCGAFITSRTSTG